MHCRIILALFAVIGIAQIARADPPSVTAVLSNSEVTAGETVELQIKVTGPGDARPPEEISIDGLEIHSTGTSRQFEIHNFSTNSSVTYNYTILPLKAGRFKIPPQTVHAGGKILRTPELALNVADAPGQQTTTRPGRNTQSQSTSERDLVFAELIVPKKTAYVGEIVPVQIRMGFDARVHPRLTEPPDITGQGFTAQKLQQASQNLETINGRPFEVVTFKTAIAAARAGKFEVGPVDLNGVAPDDSEPVDDYFAMAQFLELSDNEKLSRPSFEVHTAGMRFSTARISFGCASDAAECVLVTKIEYDTIIVDPESKSSLSVTQKYAIPTDAFQGQASLAAAAVGGMGRAGKGKYRAPGKPLMLSDPDHLLVARNTLYAGSYGLDSARRSTYAMAAEAMRKYLAKYPDARGRLQIIARHEVR
jgi:hypothetical protein